MTATIQQWDNSLDLCIPMNVAKQDRIARQESDLGWARNVEDAADLLLTNGFAILDGIADTESHIKAAGSFGTIARNSLGSLVHHLHVKTRELAHSKSLSALYGSGMFPFHTDTAFWPVPCRFLALRAVGGDLRRSTRIIRASQLLDGIPACDLARGCWIVNTGRRSFYTGLIWNNALQPRFRLDLGCMKPVNRVAKSMESEIRVRCAAIAGFEIHWKPGRTLILDNWQMLHARSSEIESEGTRSLERIYLT